MCDTYDITYSDLNPTLYFAGKRTVTESNFSHTHDAPELFIVLSGDLAIWMDGTTTPLTAGDIVCVPSHIPHRTLFDTASYDNHPSDHCSAKTKLFSCHF